MKESSLPGAVVDPVCRMRVHPDDAPAFVEYQGQKYFFCDPFCADRFRERPLFFIHEEHLKKASPARPGAVYTCPMHPEVVRNGPGDCPSCGMLLEADSLSEQTAPDPELENYKRRLWVGLFFGVPLMAVAMSPMLPASLAWANLQARLGLVWYGLLQLALCLPVVFWSGAPILQKALRSFRVGGALNMFSLIGVGVIAALALSILTWGLALLQSGSLVSTGHSSHLELYFESASMVLLFVLLGQILESAARQRTGDSLRSLLKMAPATALRKTAVGEESIPTASLKLGDTVLLRVGERVPVDCRILSGSLTLDLSLVSGESMPVRRLVGDELPEGGVVSSGFAEAEVRALSQDSFLAQVVGLVQKAQRSQLPVQKLADRVSAVFVPAVFAVSALTFVTWLGLAGTDALLMAVSHAVSVLVIACPCALGLAGPVSSAVALGVGARRGILLKSSEVLQKLSEVDTLIFDKTGTLTKGSPRIIEFVFGPGFDRERLLLWAAALQRRSQHPLARAVHDFAISGLSGAVTPDVMSFEEVPGFGVSGVVLVPSTNGERAQTVRFGSREFVESFADGRKDWLSSVFIGAHSSQRTSVCLSVDGAPCGVFWVEDPIREDARSVISRLKTQGYSVCVASGDSESAVRAVCEQLGITEYRGGMKPADKEAWVRDLQDRGARVLMVGDGINDAVAISRASVGAAVFGGTDVAQQSASLLLLRPGLSGVSDAVTLGKAAMKNVRQNLWLAFIYNLVGVPLAAGAFSAAIGWVLTPMFAGAAMSVSSVAVIANALRLRRLKFPVT
jgi:Cu+-exporting ATPase